MCYVCSCLIMYDCPGFLEDPCYQNRDFTCSNWDHLFFSALSSLCTCWLWNNILNLYFMHNSSAVFIHCPACLLHCLLCYLQSQFLTQAECLLGFGETPQLPLISAMFFPHNRTSLFLFCFHLCNWTTSVLLFPVQSLTQPDSWQSLLVSEPWQSGISSPAALIFQAVPGAVKTPIVIWFF